MYRQLHTIMARYQLLVRADNGVLTQWIVKADGSRYSTSEKDITFIVDARYSDRVTADEILKSIGGHRFSGCSSPGSDLRDGVNGWHIQLLKEY